MRLRRFKSMRVQACCILQDDWFRMGGRLYRVTNVETNHFGNPVITFTPAIVKRGYTHTLIVDKKTKFKIYNQK